MAEEAFDDRVALAARMLSRAQRTVAFTGAGISTESGLSDFRSPGGVWDRHRVVTYQEFLASGEARREYWAMKGEFYRELVKAAPNRSHLALARLERLGKLRCIITQNIDGLHQEAGSSEENVVELHGTNRRAHCTGCGQGWAMDAVQARLDEGEEVPLCSGCGGFIKPATVMFGQSMPVEEMNRAVECTVSSDLLLMIGSSLQVEPAASIPRTAHDTGSRQIFINRTETPWDHLAEVRFTEPAGEVLERIVSAAGPGP
jgi:NAD-dependent deacetylase